MGKLSTPNKFLETVRIWLFEAWQLLRRFGRFLQTILQKIWTWSRLHVPFVEAIIQRHLNNPATIFIDLAIFVLGLYLAFGVTGGILIYSAKSETKFSEELAVLYPLPAAKVGNSFIWSHEFLARLRFLNTFNKNAPSDVATRPPTDKELRKQVMDGLVENQILVLEAQNRGLSVSQDEVNAAYDAQVKVTPDLAAKVQQLYGMSVADFKEVLAEKILKQKVEAVVLERVRVSHILTTTLSGANTAAAAIKGGMSFADAAKQYSQDAQTKDNGGDLGFWAKGELAGQINQAFEDAAFSTAVGQVSAPVQSQYGFHIIDVTDKTGDNLQTYNDWYAKVLANYKVSRYISSN